VSIDAIQVRLDSHQERISDLERTLETTSPAVLAVELRQLSTQVQDLREELKANRRAQWALAVSILLGALSVAVTASQIAGG